MSIDSYKKEQWCRVCTTAKKTSTLSTDSVTNSPNARRGVLSTTYTRYKDKYTFCCANGHTWQARPSHVKASTWYPFCNYLSRALKNSPTQNTSPPTVSIHALMNIIPTTQRPWVNPLVSSMMLSFSN